MGKADSLKADSRKADSRKGSRANNRHRGVNTRNGASPLREATKQAPRSNGVNSRNGTRQEINHTHMVTNPRPAASCAGRWVIKHWAALSIRDDNRVEVHR